MGGESSSGVIVGAAVGYGSAQVEPFLRSIRATGFDGPIVLILDRKLPTPELDRIRSHDVTVHLVWNNSWLVVANTRRAKAARVVLRSPLGRAALRPASTRTKLKLHSASNRRFALYPEVRQAHPDLFDRARWVFLTDVRDVYFQDDPSAVFAEAIASGDLHLYGEGPPPGFDDGPDGVFRIGEATSTIRWVKGLSDDATGERLASERVICSGTILLTPDMMVTLSNRIVDLLDHLEPGRATFGYDQGALNLLYYTHRIADLEPVVHDNGTGGLATLGAIATRPGWEYRDDHVWINELAPPVVHQYDRVPTLKDAWSSPP